MKNDYLIIKFLDEKNLLEIKKSLSISTETDWQNGISSFIGNLETKNNIELANPYILQRISKCLYESIDANKKFANFCFPKKIEDFLVSRTLQHGYYNPHIDSGLNGQYSVTIFLSDPSTYDGGQLCFFMNNEEINIKLEPGWGIVYPTGIPHRVNIVTNGVRDVIVFWAKSFIKDPIIREICYELSEIDLGKEDGTGNVVKPYHDFESVLNQNSFKLTNIFNKLIRTYGDI
jgi:predicted 2-oxoglutarate/Fe(II)-dependent dioxygenase YbiX